MQKLLLCLAVFALLCLKTFSQDSISISYAKRIVQDDIKSYLSVLTSDSLEGRETGKPGQKKAAQFIANHFRALGLQPISHNTYLQHISLNTRANKGNNFEINQKFFLFMKDYFYLSGFADTLLTLDTIAFCGYGIRDPNYDDYKGVNLKNRTVLFYAGEPQKEDGKVWITKSNQGSSWKNDFISKLNLARENGAKAALIITDSIPMEKEMNSWNYKENLGSLSYVLFQINGELKANTIPFAFISRSMANSFFPKTDSLIAEKAKNKINKKGKPRSFVTATNAKLKFVKNTDSLRGENVVGFLEGTDKKGEVLVITGHYDHLGKKDSVIYHGADDDGSGTSGVMELAKIFSEAAKEGHRPRRSILFMTVSGEEKGLLGSNYYVTHPLLPLSNTVADLNIDMIGRTDVKHDSLGVRDYVYIIGSDKLSTQLHKIDSSANAVFTKMELDYTFNKPDDPNRFYYRSDHYNFAKNNIPIIFYFNGVHKDYHKPTDTFDKIQFDLLAKRAQLVFLTAWELANREERIKVDVNSDMLEKKD